MGIFKPRLTIGLLLGFASVLLPLLVYVSAYLALVKREPYYGGSNLRGIVFEFSHFDRDSRKLPVAQLQRIPPNGYRAKYLVPGQAVSAIFAPAHQVDRILRPSYWPRIKYRDGC